MPIFFSKSKPLKALHYVQFHSLEKKEKAASLLQVVFVYRYVHDLLSQWPDNVCLWSFFVFPKRCNKVEIRINRSTVTIRKIKLIKCHVTPALPEKISGHPWNDQEALAWEVTFTGHPVIKRYSNSYWNIVLSIEISHWSRDFEATIRHMCSDGPADSKILLILFFFSI